VHQDGLVHVSAMSKTFVKDPRDVVKPGDIVRVKVVGVDVPRKRISLTLRLDDETSAEAGAPTPRQPAQPGSGSPRPQSGRDRGGRDRGGRPGSGRAGGGGGEGGGRAGASAPDTALAEALRRAGLTP
jgi:uncharacterized protein